MAYFLFNKDKTFKMSSISPISETKDGDFVIEGPNDLLMKSVDLVDGTKIVEHEIPKIQKMKNQRMVSVGNITVSVDGLVFDGNERSQQRMIRAIILSDSEDDKITWILADGTKKVVTIKQLKAACKAAFKVQTSLWTKPYEE